jgi:CheY-like chemotaxis protein
MATVNILLVEDDVVDVKAVKRAFHELKIHNPLFEARDGVEALEMLRGTGDRPAVPHPRIILLDLNMPRMGGLEFLDALRQDPALQRSVVFVMTTSSSEQDRVGAYDRHVAGYVLKHSPAHSFLEAVRMVEHYCLVVELPDTP